MKVPFCF